MANSFVIYYEQKPEGIQHFMNIFLGNVESSSCIFNSIRITGKEGIIWHRTELGLLMLQMH